MFPPFQKHLNPQVRTNKMVNNVVYHPCLSRLASSIHLSFFFKLRRVLSLQNACWIFSSLYIPPCIGKNFQIMVFTLRENALNRFLLIPQFPTQNSRQKFLKICFSQDERGGETMICFIKIKLEIMKMTWNIGLFILCMIYDFFKYLSNSVLLSLLPLLCNYGNLTLKLYLKK